MSEPDSILPEIVIDDTAEDYVETDDEPSTPPAKSKPPATEIFEQENEPAPVPVVEPVIPKKPKRQVSEKQRQHLASIRAKALEARKANAKAKREAKTKASKPPEPAPVPAPAPAPAPQPASRQQQFNDADVDQLLDRYKARRRVKKEAKRKDEEVRRKVQHVAAPPVHDDPWAECSL